MRVVDDDGEVLPRLHELEAPGHRRERAERRADVRGRDVLRERRAHGAHDVVDIEDARDVQRELHAAERRMDEREARAVCAHVDILGAQRRLRRVDGVGEVVALRVREHARARFVVDVHDGRLALLHARLAHMVEEARLRAHVVLERLMVVEMILREVREDRRIELDARDAVLVERVGGDLHDDVVHARVAHARERVLQLDDIRRRVVDGQHLVLDHDLDRADEADLVARVAQDSAREVARRRLAVRARDADDAQRARGIVMEIRHDRVERRIELRHAQHRDARGRRERMPLRREHGEGALLHRLRDELRAVHMHAGNRHEQRPRAHLARVVLDACDLYLLTAAVDVRALHERCELAKCLHILLLLTGSPPSARPGFLPRRALVCMSLGRLSYELLLKNRPLLYNGTSDFCRGKMTSCRKKCSRAKCSAQPPALQTLSQ